MIPIKLFDKLALAIKNIRVRTGPKNVARNVNAGTFIQANSLEHHDNRVTNALDVKELAVAIVEHLGPMSDRPRLTWSEPPALPATPRLEVIPGAALAIIKAFDLDGSRVHLPFDVHNDADEPVSVIAAGIVLNGCHLFAKQFYINRGPDRIPDPTVTFPVMVKPHETVPFNIEFGNAAAGPVFSAGVIADLTLKLDAGTDATVRFVAPTQNGLRELLEDLQRWCDRHQAATAFDLEISPTPTVAATG